MTRPRRPLSLIVLPLLFVLAAPLARAAETLPSELSASAFWSLVETLSEPGGQFQSENFLSNESGLQDVIPALQRAVAPGGVYLGVGPEQNFTYIAALRPKMAFVVDIRRQNMVEHLVYKALFEMSADRAEFLSRLFSRARPSALTEQSTVDDLLRAYEAAPAGDDQIFSSNVEAVRAFLVEKRRFALTDADRDGLTRVLTVFREFGPSLNYNSRPGVPSAPGRGRGMPTYADVMTSADADGRQWGYLATEANYRFVRDLQVRNLVVPITGDFGGSKAIRAIGRYLKDHGATVSAFYTSNVEQYLFQGADTRGNLNGGGTHFFANVAALPLDAASVFVQSSNAGGRGTNAGRGFVGAAGRSNVFASIQETLAAVQDGRIRTYNDLFALSR